MLFRSSIKASSVAGIENTTDESTDDDSMHTDTDQQEKVSDHNAVDNEEKTDEIDKEENDGEKEDTKENDTNENDTKENNTKDTVNTGNTDTEDKKNNADKINTTESINSTESINATECIGDIDSTEYDTEQDDGIMLLNAGVSLELLAVDSINSGVTWMADSDTIKATLKGFVLLSNCQPGLLQHKNIIVESTGSSNITEEVEYNGQKYKYAGIGTADCIMIAFRRTTY